MQSAQHLRHYLGSGTARPDIYVLPPASGDLALQLVSDSHLDACKLLTAESFRGATMQYESCMIY